MNTKHASSLSLAEVNFMYVLLIYVLELFSASKWCM